MSHSKRSRRSLAGAAGLGALWLASAASADAPRAPALTNVVAITDSAAPPAPDAEPLEGARVLDREALVRQVLERNPELEAARAAWQAALARPEQVESLDDPVLTYEVAPLSLFARETRFGQTIGLSQKLPFPGKRALAGEVARAEAEAARGDFEAARLRLALMASMLYDDLYVVHRALAVNVHHQEVLREMRRSAEAQYVAGRASQADPL
ncbi:MAG TPA: TolC family protein, partial [Myxococcaceae bacterium]|nr:TolC family protein [Myxococcaceae bacterium]